jgi:hypothetical protein
VHCVRYRTFYIRVRATDRILDRPPKTFYKSIASAATIVRLINGDRNGFDHFPGGVAIIITVCIITECCRTLMRLTTGRGNADFRTSLCEICKQR